MVSRIFGLVALIVLLPARTQAGSVEWNYLRLDELGSVERIGINGMETWREYCWAEPYFEFCAHLVGETLVMQAQYGVFMEYAYDIVVARNGDMADARYAGTASFCYMMPDGETTGGYSLAVPLGATAYLAYTVAFGNLGTGAPPDPLSPERWGWLELKATENGDLVLVRDAVSWSDPLVVGAIPEPSSVLLLLAGGALLALRRRRTKGRKPLAQGASS